MCNCYIVVVYVCQRKIIKNVFKFDKENQEGIVKNVLRGKDIILR